MKISVPNVIADRHHCAAGSSNCEGHGRRQINVDVGHRSRYRGSGIEPIQHHGIAVACRNHVDAKTNIDAVGLVVGGGRRQEASLHSLHRPSPCRHQSRSRRRDLHSPGGRPFLFRAGRHSPTAYRSHFANLNPSITIAVTGYLNEVQSMVYVLSQFHSNDGSQIAIGLLIRIIRIAPQPLRGPRLRHQHCLCLLGKTGACWSIPTWNSTVPLVGASSLSVANTTIEADSCVSLSTSTNIMQHFSPALVSVAFTNRTSSTLTGERIFQRIAVRVREEWSQKEVRRTQTIGSGFQRIVK